MKTKNAHKGGKRQKMVYAEIESKDGMKRAFVELDFIPEIGAELPDGSGGVWIVKSFELLGA